MEVQNLHLLTPYRVNKLSPFDECCVQGLTITAALNALGRAPLGMKLTLRGI